MGRLFIRDLGYLKIDGSFNPTLFVLCAIVQALENDPSCEAAFYRSRFELFGRHMFLMAIKKSSRTPLY